MVQRARCPLPAASHARPPRPAGGEGTGAGSRGAWLPIAVSSRGRGRAAWALGGSRAGSGAVGGAVAEADVLTAEEVAMMDGLTDPRVFPQPCNCPLVVLYMYICLSCMWAGGRMMPGFFLSLRASVYHG